MSYEQLDDESLEQVLQQIRGLKRGQSLRSRIRARRMLMPHATLTLVLGTFAVVLLMMLYVAVSLAAPMAGAVGIP